MASSFNHNQIEPSVVMYMENYLEFAENTPGTLSRFVTRIHEIDNERTSLVRRISKSMHQYSKLTIQEDKCKLLGLLTNLLIRLQDITDTKLCLTQSINEQIELRKYQLDLDYRSASSSLNLGSQSSQNNSSSLTQHSTTNGTGGSSGKTNNGNLNSNSSNSYAVTQNTSADRNSPAAASKESRADKESSNGKRISRRYQGVNRNHDVNNNSGDDRSSTPVTTANDKNGSSKRATKRGNGKVSNKQDKRSKVEISNDNTNDTPDEDEPIYCSCRQVSFGEMIGCDNDQCKFEWFHFSCVSLNSKPKGKWYCPDCRGERSNIPRK